MTHLLERVIDARTGVIRYERDAKLNVVAVIDQLNRRWEMTRDSAGNVTSIKDPQNRTTLFEYDGLNRLVKVTDALGDNALPPK